MVALHPDISNKLPNLKLGCINCSAIIESSSIELQQFIASSFAAIKPNLTAESIRQTPTIKATKEGYRLLGKDPSRYRPSAEALLRRIADGRDLYQISNVVDLINWSSCTSGYSIGGYDADKIEGNITLGIGQKEEPYEGIGRGILNIEGLPVFRDSKGAFGSPTSDSPRTMITEETTNITLIYLAFSGENGLLETMNAMQNALSQFANAKEFKLEIID